MELFYALLKLSLLMGVSCENQDKDVKLNFMKIVRADFRTEGGWCMNPFKSLRHVSRYETLLDVGCESFSRPMKKLYLNYTMKIKPDTANNFRQIIQITNMDLCAALDDMTRVSLASEYLDQVNVVFPGALHKCPYTSFKLFNGTHGPGWNQHNTPTVNPIPNGLIRHSIIIGDDRVTPEAKLNLTLYLILRIHNSNFFLSI